MIPPLSICIIDDDSEDAFLLREALEDALGCDVFVSTHVKTFAQALTILTTSCPYDVCFSDYRLGPETGLDLIQAARAAGCDTPIILMTGQGDEDLAVAALKAGADDYLRKSALTPEAVSGALRHALQVRAAERARCEAETALRREKEFAAAILRHSYDGIAVVAPNDQFTFVSPGMERLFGLPAASFTTLPTLAKDLRFEPIPPEPFDADAWSATLRARLPAPQERTIRFAHPTAPNPRAARLQFSAAPNGDMILNGQDITDTLAAQDEIRRLAFHDPLTGLANRKLFLDRLNIAVNQSQRRADGFALIYLDLDRFKPVNDRYGHDAGDFVLRTIASRLSDATRSSDTVARLGGDEFAIIAADAATPTHLAPLLARLTSEIQRPAIWQGTPLTVGASLGTAFFPTDATSPETLIRHADASMYRCKSK